MKITKIQLKRIIKEEVNKLLKESEFAPTAEEEAKKINVQTGIGLTTDQAYWEESGISTGEELALSLLHQNYSDTYKSIHGIRPRWAKFETVDEVQAALNDLDREVKDMIAAEELDKQRQVEYEKKQKEMQALMPTGYERSITRDFPKQTGFGKTKRTRLPKMPRSTDPAAYGYTRESVGKLTKTKLRRLIREVYHELRGATADGSTTGEAFLPSDEGVITPEAVQGAFEDALEQLKTARSPLSTEEELRKLASNQNLKVAFEDLQRAMNYQTQEDQESRGDRHGY